MFLPSKYQTAVFDGVKSAQHSILVNALAGSGKSKTLEEAAKKIPDESICALAFNKSIATELQARLPRNAQAATLNSLGHRAWMRHQGSGVTLQADKVRQLVKAVIPWDRRDQSSMVSSLVSKAKIHGLVPQGNPALGLLPDVDSTWLMLADRYSIDLPNDPRPVITAARQVLARSLTMLSVIDFDDQLYLPVVFNIEFPQYDRVFVDESQDLSNIQIEMIKRLGDKDTRYLLVGDRRQAIYAFRGADTNAMDRLRTELNCIELPLSITYRCPQKVVELARRYEPTMEAAPNAPEGIVRDGGLASMATYEPNDMVICRFSAPVMKLAYSLLGRGVRVRVIGRDLAEGLKSLVYRLKPASTNDLLMKLGAWETAQVDALIAADASDEKIEAVRDRAETLRTVTLDSGASTVDQVIERLDSLFADKANAVVLSTVHRAKGLEAHRVFVIDHERRAFSRTPEQQQQETNIQYIALTRAKHELVFVSTEGTPNAKP